MRRISLLLVVVLVACTGGPTPIRATTSEGPNVLFFAIVLYFGMQSYFLTQRGMFSYSGLTKEQVQRLRKDYSIYAIETGRICVAALNSGNVDYVAEAIAKVIQ